ncbi:MAG: Hachiman antiphage defense system protein HamA [Dysosmobacter sp.]|jgi:hypothetical protein
MGTIESRKFNEFNVFSVDEKTSFLHVNLSDDSSFYRGLVKYFLDETRLLKYAENKTNLVFSPERRNYITLFKHLGHYIDDYNQEILPGKIEEEVLRILADEYQLNDAGDGRLHVRLDKIGKLGEYIFCNLLSEYFGFDCIIPKVHLTTDFNMSVFGIDALFYSTQNDMILFGESKLSKSLENGIGLLNKSLKTYERQIKDEFVLMLSNRFLKNNMGIFGDKYADAIELSLSVEEFISTAKVQRIGIPLFIAHGTDINTNEIFQKLSSINYPAILGLETQYIAISLPIVDKSKIISMFTQEIAERRAFYEQSAISQ